MSSQICSPEHFNSIEHTLENNSFDVHGSIFPFSTAEMYPELYYSQNYPPKKVAKKIGEVIDVLRELNVICFFLQYKAHYQGTVDKEIQEQFWILQNFKQGKRSLTEVELYKAVLCLDYNIEPEHLQELRELTVPESNALFFLKELKHHLAHEIVYKLPEYQEAAWSIGG